MIEFLVYPLEIALLLLLNYFLFRKVKGRTDIKFLILLNFSLILWIVSTILVLVYNTNPSSVWFVRFTFVGTVFSVLSFALFVQVTIKKRLDWGSYVFTLLSFGIATLSLTNVFVKGLDVYSGELYPSVEYGSIPWIFMAYVIIGIIWGMVTIFINRQKITGTESLRIRYLMLGLFVTGILAVITNMILPLLTDVASTSLWGTVSVSAISISTSYAMLNTRLFGIRYLLFRFLYYFTKILLIVSLYFGVNYFTDYFYNSYFVVNKTFSIIFLIIISIFVFNLVFEFLDKSIFKNFQTKGVNRDLIKRNFAQKVNNELSLNVLSAFTLQTFEKLFSIHDSALILGCLEDETVIFKDFKNYSKIKINDSEVLNIIEYFGSNTSQKVLISEELQYNDKLRNDRKLEYVYNLMNTWSISAIFSLSNNDQYQGLIFLGRKNYTLPYTKEDIEFISEILLSVSVAFSRSLLYKQVQDFNDTLQQKVNIQTKELQVKVKELEEARRKEADMIDIMGHELRTPATIVKLNAQLLDQIIKKKDIKSLNKYVSRIQDGVEREIKLINTLLSSAKLEGDKIKLEPEEVDLKPEIEMSLHAYEQQAKQKGLKLIDNTPDKIHTVFGDHARIVEIVNNLISNAVKYTEKGSVTIESSEYGNIVQLDFIDTGAGIPEKDIPNLGKKFYRVQTYIDAENSDDVNIVRPGGTGLGLYVVFQLVRKMGGDIHVKSELGKGSVFSITLPKYVGQSSQKPTTESLNMFERMGLTRNESVQD